MNKKAFSMTVAAAVAALTWVAGAQAQDPSGPPPHGPEFRHHGPGGPDGPMLGGRLAEELGLTAEQKSQLEAARAKQFEKMRPLMETARQAHEAFRAALDAEGADPTTVGQAALAMNAAEKSLRAAHEAAFEDMKAILTPEQREKLEQMKARRANHGPGGERRPPFRP